MNYNSKIYVAGHNGLVGSAILKKLISYGYSNIILKTKSELDLTNQYEVNNFFCKEKPDYVFIAAAKVGGIFANNKYRADFIYNNLMIQTNIIHCSWKYNVKKLLFLGSTCIYPKDSPQPIDEISLLTSPLEYSNEPYAIAKIAGIKMCESYNIQYGTNFISVMPTNLYGPNDNFDLETSHVLPALIRKFYLGKCLEINDWASIKKDLNNRPLQNINGNFDQDEILKILKYYGITIRENNVHIEIWGSGKQLREFLWSEDMADACIFVMNNINFKDLITNSEIRNTHLNIGTGSEISIKELSELIKYNLNFNGCIDFNQNKLDGTFRKLTNPNKLKKLGWSHKIDIEEGVKDLINWYKHSV